MFAIRFITEAYAPNQIVYLRWGPDEKWDIDRGGVYTDGAWTFDLDEADFPDGIQFKFVLAPGVWMQGVQNLALRAAECVGKVDYNEDQVKFPARDALVTENGVVQQRLLHRNLDPNHVYDVVVVGSGMGGGVLASRLADAGADVLLVEAGSYLFPTHVGNLPRRLRFGQFDKHIWSLWETFKVTNYINTPGSNYNGGQGFNLGGRSVFWGGLIPRQAEWELQKWPTAVREYLLANGYPDAEGAVNRVEPDPSQYQESSRVAIQDAFAGYTASNASMAVQYRGATKLSIPSGLFSTADLLMEDVLSVDGLKHPTINLNFAVWKLTVDPHNLNRVTGISGIDLLARKERTFSARTVVLAAGTIESAKIALQSGLNDPNGKIGRGITDHTIRFRHFTLPPHTPHWSEDDSAKVLLRHPNATVDEHAFDIVIELGADLNQGRYIDPLNLALERSIHQQWMLCELVFMYYADLEETNLVTLQGNDPGNPVSVTVKKAEPSPANISEADELAASFFNAWGAKPVFNEDPSMALADAEIGNVAHEVGTLRMAGDATGVVDDNLKFLDYDNLYACDNSVFPTSPAANPSLTLAALALRLAGTIHH